jgi:hypothetical protein
MMAQAWQQPSSQGIAVSCRATYARPCVRPALSGFCGIEEVLMGGSPEEARARAEAKFQKQQLADQQAAAAKAECEAQARAVEANTARLKSLRLAREVADKEAAARATPTDTSGTTKAATTKKKRSP